MPPDYTAGMEDADVYAISVEVAPRFLDDQSAPEDGRYAFAYTIRIHNQGRVAARLVARHWRITDANGRVEHVDGEGVIGEQPRLRPGEDFRYTSGVMLGTDRGTMQGHYDMVADDGTEFAAPVAPFHGTVRRSPAPRTPVPQCLRDALGSRQLRRHRLHPMPVLPATSGAVPCRIRPTR